MQITKKTVLLCVFLESKTFTHLHDVNNPAGFFYIHTNNNQKYISPYKSKIFSSLAITVINKLVG